MQKLGALDANFLYSETELILNHIASVQRFELPEGVSAAEFAGGLKQFLMGRLHLVPYLYRKLRFVPGNFDHPFWVNDKAFNIDNHVTEVKVPSPGGLKQTEETVARLHATKMRRDRPLWHIYVLTGLEDGAIAYYNQVHHAAIDGMGGQAAIRLLMDETPDHLICERPASFSLAGREDAATLMRMTFENLMQFQLGNAKRMMGSLESTTRMFQRAFDPSRHFGALGERAPKTRFNRMIGRERTWATGEFSMEDIRALGRQMGCTVNDVFMTICSGALRSYLQRNKELPSTDLIAGCPVSLRGAHDNDMGNRVTMMNVNLATHIADPCVRMLFIHRSAEIAKHVTADLAHGYEPNVSLPGLPAMMAMAAVTAEGSRMANLAPPPVNVVISNIPGPKKTLYSNGARMLTHHPVSIPGHGIGLNITVQSYAGRLYFGITAAAAAVPDADRLRDDMMTAHTELRQSLMPANITDLWPVTSQPRMVASDPNGGRTRPGSPAIGSA